MKIALLNTTICTGGAGQYNLQKVDTEYVRTRIFANDETTSYIGHESTAILMTTLLGTPVAFSRAQFKHDADTMALCFKLNGRPEEGKVLTVAEIEAIGYEWYNMTFIPAEAFIDDRDDEGDVKSYRQEMDDARHYGH